MSQGSPVAATLILAVEIYIALRVKGGFVRRYVGDVLAVVSLYALARVVFSVPPSNLPFRISRLGKLNKIGGRGEI